jgi:hexosaminidase
MNAWSIFVLALLAIVSTSPQVTRADEFAIIPRPAELKPEAGAFVLNARTVIIAPAQCASEAQYLADALAPATGYQLRVQREPAAAPGAITLTLDTQRTDLGDEGYTLQVTPVGIAIAATRPAGAFYAVQTLRQLLPTQVFAGKPQTGVAWRVPCVVITDQPRFPWRGMMLDSSRHFQPKSYIERYLDLMALHKLNVFHWHLVDDHGWRLEIKKYPKLTSVGAWRKQPGYPDNNGIYGGFYTQDDIRQVVAYAAVRHITIVPEIEMPGHSQAALAAYPELSCEGKPGYVAYFYDYPCRFPRWPANSANVYCAGNDTTFEFLQDVLTETMDLFPGQYIHVGGDEVDKKYWHQCPKCQARMHAEGLKDEIALQSYFMKRIEKFVNAHGRKLIGWDEIIEGGLAPNASVMSWRGIKGGIAAAKAGHSVVMCPVKPLYLNQPQVADPLMPTSLERPGFSNPMKNVYQYDPVPAGLTPAQEKLILGAQGNLWTEFLNTPLLWEWTTFPRQCAVAEIDWTPQKLHDFEDFRARLRIHCQRLDALGVNYCKTGN